MEITTEIRDGVDIVSVTGRLTADCAADFKKQMLEILNEQAKIVLDLAGMEYIDSTGLGAMVHVLQKVSDAGKQLNLARIQAKPRLVFNITRVYKLFDIFDTVDEAVGALNG